MKPINKNSEYFRICPNDGKEFMADHMNRIYCIEKDGKKNKYK